MTKPIMRCVNGYWTCHSIIEINGVATWRFVGHGWSMEDAYRDWDRRRKTR